MAWNRGKDTQQRVENAKYGGTKEIHIAGPMS